MLIRNTILLSCCIDDMDVNSTLDHHHPIQGQVILHTTQDKSSSPFAVNTPVVNSIAPVLKKLLGCYSPIQSIAIFLIYISYYEFKL
jgi:hypothetical protein